jgi:hypothetical protein
MRQQRQQTTARRTESITPVEILGFSLAALLIVTSMGCGFTGESGNMRFVYETAEFSAKRPIAVDAKVQLNAYENKPDSNSDEYPVELTDVTSSDSGVIEVEAVGDSQANRFRLAARGEGSVDISVEGTTETGSSISDSFTLSSKQAAEVQFEHPCNSESNDPVYLTDQTHVIDMELRSDDGDRLIGWGYRPVNISGPGSGYDIATSVKRSDRLGVSFGSQAGEVTVDSTIDDASIAMDAMGESSIDTLSWFGSDSGTPPLVATSSSEGRLFPKFEINGRPACTAEVDLSYSIQTPNVCDVESEYLDPGEELLAEVSGTRTSVLVTEKMDDTCRFDVSVAEASSVSTSVELDLKENGPDEQQDD